MKFGSFAYKDEFREAKEIDIVYSGLEEMMCEPINTHFQISLEKSFSLWIALFSTFWKFISK